MIEITDQSWNKLQTAYGSASSIPLLLQELAKNSAPRESTVKEPWFTLWSNLCHQGSVYTASYAAVPHLIQIALETEHQIDFNFFLLPSCIEIARINKAGPEILGDLADDYFEAIKKIPLVVVKHMNDEWNSSMVKSVCAALAVAKGHTDFAQKLIDTE